MKNLKTENKNQNNNLVLDDKIINLSPQKSSLQKNQERKIEDYTKRHILDSPRISPLKQSKNILHLYQDLKKNNEASFGNSEENKLIYQNKRGINSPITKNNISLKSPGRINKGKKNSILNDNKNKNLNTKYINSPNNQSIIYSPDNAELNINDYKSFYENKDSEMHNSNFKKDKEVPNIIKRFDWSLLFRDALDMDFQLNLINGLNNNFNCNKNYKEKLKREKNESSKKDSKMYLQNLLSKSRDVFLQNLKGEKNINISSNTKNEDYVKIITSDRTSIKNNNQEFNLEEEIERLNDGMCFGEWGLMYNLPRSASAYTMEDTHLLYLDKEFFKYCFFKSMYRAISEKKSFFLKTLPFLRGLAKVEEFLKNVNPIVNIFIFWKS